MPWGGDVAGQLDRLNKELDTHMADRYAHGAAREAGGPELAEWRRWRASVDRWRWATAGGLAVLCTLITSGLGVWVLTQLVSHGR